MLGWATLACALLPSRVASQGLESLHLSFFEDGSWAALSSAGGATSAPSRDGLHHGQFALATGAQAPPTPDHSGLSRLYLVGSALGGGEAVSDEAGDARPDFSRLSPPLPRADAPWKTFEVKTANRRLIGSLGEERARLVSVNATLADPDSADRVEAVGEMVYRPLVPGELDMLEAGLPAPLLRFGISGSAGRVGYGVNAQSVGKGLEGLATSRMKKDRRGGDVWAAVRLGMGRLKLSLAQYSDNVDEDPRRLQMRNTQGGVTVEITPPAWPTLSVSYANGFAESHPVTESKVGRAPPSSVSAETVGASLYYYGGSSWDLSVSSAYSQKRDTVHGDQQTMELTGDLNGAYRPTETVTVTPALSYWEERYRWLREGVQTVSASLTVGYSPPPQVVSVLFLGSYSRTVAGHGDVDGTVIDVRSTLVWAYGQTAEKLRLAFELGYSRYLDAVYSASSHEAVSALVLLRLVPSP